MKILRTLNTQPAPLRDGICSILRYRALRKPLAELRGHRVVSVSDTVHAGPDELSGYDATWFYTHLSPCLFMGVTKRGDDGSIIRAAAGHFSAQVGMWELCNFLSPFENPKGMSVFFAGFGSRSSLESLNKSSLLVAMALQDFGLRYRLVFEEPDKPVLSAGPGWLAFSDLGRDLLGPDPAVHAGRHVAFGVNGSSSLLLSARFSGKDASDWVEAHVISEETGAVKIDPEDYADQ